MPRKSFSFSWWYMCTGSHSTSTCNEWACTWNWYPSLVTAYPIVSRQRTRFRHVSYRISYRSHATSMSQKPTNSSGTVPGSMHREGVEFTGLVLASSADKKTTNQQPRYCNCLEHTNHSATMQSWYCNSHENAGNSMVVLTTADTGLLHLILHNIYCTCYRYR